MKTQHAPGPYHAVNHYICNANNQVIARVCASNADDMLNCHFDHLANIGMDETASLIAAAPELLEALEAMLETFEPSNNLPIIDTARAAVSKARGEL